jgi:hypothetical protein
LIPQSITNANELEIILQQLMVPDSQAIRNAEKVLKQFTQNQVCLAAFVQQIQTSSNLGVRQAAAVIMRAKIKIHWQHLDHDSKEYIKKCLLEILMKEIDPRVRSSVISLVGEVARYEVPRNNWGELAQFLMNCVQSAQSAYREVGMFLFSILIEECGEQMKVNLSHVLQVFQSALVDDSFPVKLAALKAVQSFVTTIEKDKEMVAIVQLIPSIIDVIKQCIHSHQENIALNAFEIFDELVERKSTAFDSSIPPLMQFMLEIAENAHLDLEIRDRAATFMSWVIAFRPNIIIKQKIFDPIINVAFKMLLEPEDDDIEEDDLTGYKIGSSLLDELAVAIPSKYIFHNIITFAARLTTSRNSVERKAGVTAIGLIAEGCHQPMRTNLGQLVPILVKACYDESRQVKEAATLALASFSEYLKPEVMDYYEQIIPALNGKLDDPTFEVREKICYTLDLFCQHLGDKITPFIQSIMNNLLALLTRGDRKTQEIALPVISATAMAAKENFLPYCTHLLPMMKQILEYKDNNDELLLLRGNAIECVGLIAVSVGKKHFAPYIDTFMNIAINSIKEINHAEMREYTYRFFENMATTLEEDFVRYLPIIVPSILHTIENDDVLQRVTQTQAEFTFEESENNDDSADAHYTVRSSQLDEKAAAISALAAIIQATKQQFAPYLEKAIKIFIDEATYFHYSVRRNAMRGLKNVLYVVIPKSIAYSAETLNEQQIALLNKVMMIFVSTMVEDDDKETVAIVCESISDLCRDFGKKIIERNVESICSALNALLAQKCPCNNNALEEAEESTDHDIILIDTVSDAIADIARAIGPEFAHQFQCFLPELCKYANPNRDAGDKMMALGTMAECADAMRSATVLFVKDILPYAVNGIKDSQQDVKRNSIFLFGVLAYHLKQQIEPYILQFLSLLHPIFTNMDKYANVVVDNACGAIARIIIAQYQIPLDQVLPAFIAALPLREDFEENDIVYSSILALIRSGNQAAAQNMKGIISILAKALSLDSTQQEVRNKIADTLRQVKQNYGTQFNQVLAQCDVETQRILSTI